MQIRSVQRDPLSPLIELKNINVAFEQKTALQNINLNIYPNSIITIVGPNGGGKSTLLKVLTGREQPDEGRVSQMNDIRVAMVTQEANLNPEDTVADVVLKPLGVETFEWASKSSVRDVLDGLGITELGLDSKVGQLSGGERRRTNLAAALVQELDLLVLDEPTNHLDVEGVQWLADYLLKTKAALVVVTHDRWFLDTVATRTWEVHDGRVDTYEGGYNDWVYARAERARQADAVEQRRRNLARKELAWLRRGAPARTSKPRYRIEAAEALIADVPAPRDTVELMAFSKQRQGKVVIELEDAYIATPDGRDLVRDLTWRLAPGERIGLVGVNGSGKTTLLRVLAGEYALGTGRRLEGKTVRLGWLRQELDDLDPTMRLLDAVESVASYVQFGKKELSASQLAERLGFSAKRQRTPVGDLSGGERRRLQLTRVLMAEPNVLLLDEPTNDLDIDTLQELESLLDSWPGTLVVISHDRYLIERICDSTWALFGDGRLTNLPGGIDEYLRRRRDMAGSGVIAGGGSAAVAEKKRDAAADHKTRKAMTSLERKITKLQEREQGITAKMAEVATDMDALNELNTELAGVRDEIETLEMEWMELGEQLEG